jgi:hypothetical protein
LTRIKNALYGPASLKDFWEALDQMVVSTVVATVGAILCPETAGAACVAATAAIAGIAGQCVDDCKNVQALALSAVFAAMTDGMGRFPRVGPKNGPVFLSEERWTHIKDGHFPGGNEVTSNEGVFTGSEQEVQLRMYDAIFRGRPMKNTDGRSGYTYTVDFGGYSVGYKTLSSGQRINLQFYTVVVTDEGRIWTAYPH